ncbi:hypothetical protein [Ferrimonas balearica]|uniref:hypothetical protein n=1 Tax=Ferrimonas balearica TaxID=44012 RepID=UPI001F1EA319|nr:hypothetical protein [Ferrimonas balearica]MBY6018741.1 hypothetical protein [Halomonas denitrificans]MBY6095931.1 hypothetical protein [Ferrimonas balearica]
MAEVVLSFLLVAAVVAMVLAWRSPSRFVQWARVLGLSQNSSSAVSEDLAARERLAELEKENAEIKARLQVLETIVTDSSYELDQRIRKLG